jgi:hypothetical protein
MATRTTASGVPIERFILAAMMLFLTAVAAGTVLLFQEIAQLVP